MTGLPMAYKLLPNMRNKRELLARAFGRLGVLRLLERLVAATRPVLVVFTYHRIAEPGSDPFYDPVISATPDSFCAQIEWLRRSMRILTLPELVAQLEPGSPWHEPAALVTFDDGYRDNFEVAIPMLRERAIPATFFLPTAFLDTPRLPWWDQVAYVIKRTQMRRLVLERSLVGNSPPLEIDLGSVPRSAAIMIIIRAFLDGTISDEPWFLTQLAALAEISVDSESLARALFASWDQVRQNTMLDPTLTIGSHGHSHERLAALDEDSQHHELFESKRILESRLGHDVVALAYPYGWRDTYNTETKSLAARAGYRMAFTASEGVNRPDVLDPYELRRLGVGSGDTAELLRARTALCSAFGRSFL
jgi:peptidoglycan/xylan/chitin deacetylase (PgdA/CDA1 family)